jgi:N-acyl-D-amino-acid deacylase
VLSLEEAVGKMTSLPAVWMRQGERGLLREGAIADVVVFDFGTIQDEAAYTDPHHYSTCVIHVFVGGAAVLDNGEIAGQRPGRLLG